MFFSILISDNANRPNVLFNAIDSVLNLTKKKGVIEPTPFDQPLIPTLSSSLTHFEPVTSDQLAEVVSKRKCSSYKLDILSPCLFKEVFMTISYSVTAIMNSSLASGVFPSSFKNAILHSFLGSSNTQQLQNHLQTAFYVKSKYM